MGTNHNEDEYKDRRWRVLDQLLSEGKPRTKEEIIQELGRHRLFVSNDTFRKDIDQFRIALEKVGLGEMLLREKGGTVKEDGSPDLRKKTYRYKTKGFKAIGYLNYGMTNGEYNKLKKAIEKLRSLMDDEVFDEVEFALLSRIEADYKKGVNRVEYEDNKWLKGREFRPLIYQAIRDKRALRIEYETFKGKKESFVFHPYLLKQYNDRWYAFGSKEGVNNPYWVVPLDRITNRPTSAGKYTEACPPNYLEYFDNIVGISKTKKAAVQHIVIRIDDIEAWGRISTKPLPTQKEIQPFDLKSGNGRISLDLIPNEELFSKIRSWGEYVEVESPTDVRNRVVNTLKQMLAIYSTESIK
ncbi:MAG: WYL domain-containing protein [Bacteroidales bacterium]|nr:WYL domain-containing protein [Bacteroidales bacterium]